MSSQILEAAVSQVECNMPKTQIVVDPQNKYFKVVPGLQLEFSIAQTNFIHYKKGLSLILRTILGKRDFIYNVLSPAHSAPSMVDGQGL